MRKLSIIAYTFTCCLFALLAVLIDRREMALLRSRAPTNIGSAPWILKERNEIQLLVNQDSEAFALAARNEAEWLNDHMAKVFGRNEMYTYTTSMRRSLTNLGSNLADMLKTPSRLRGKTPATAWKRNGLEARVVSRLQVHKPARSNRFLSLSPKCSPQTNACFRALLPINSLTSKRRILK